MKTRLYLSDMGSHRDKFIFRTSSIQVSTLCCNSCSTIYAYIWRISTIQATQINCSWLKSILCCNKVYKLVSCVTLDIFGLAIENPNWDDHLHNKCDIGHARSITFGMDNLHVRLTFSIAKTNKIFYHNQKELPKISRIAKFGGEML